MVPDDYYKNICSKPNYNIHLEEEYPKSFILYRLAKDNFINYGSKEYQKYNSLLKNS